LSGRPHAGDRVIPLGTVNEVEGAEWRTPIGEFNGFESAAMLRAFVRLLVQTYDLVLAVVF
jgi:hypothetical protein